MQCSNQVRTLLRRIWASATKLLLHIILCAWSACQKQTAHKATSSATVAASVYDRAAKQLDMNIALTQKNLKHICALKTPYVIRDKLASFDRAADEAQNAENARDSKQLFRIVRRLAGTPHKALSSLKDPSGKVMTSRDEVTACWRRHFEKLFKAAVADDKAQRWRTLVQPL